MEWEVMSPNATPRVYMDMHMERMSAHTKHAPRGGSMEELGWDNPVRLPVLVEEVGEVARALCELFYHRRGPRDGIVANLREELVQVGAMAAAWIDAIDRGTER